MKAPTPANETARLAELHAYNVLDTLAEEAYDDITFLASEICGSPIALVSLVDTNRQWVKSKVGLDIAETPRDVAFCAHAILDPTAIMVVKDATADVRFSENPLVTDEPGIRFYAGAPLVTSSGNALGTLCVIDREPRELTARQEKGLEALARVVMARLELRSMVIKLEESAAKQRNYETLLEQYQRSLEKSLETVGLQSMTDSLTELRNRRAFLEHLDSEFERCGRYRSQLSLAMLDVDHFKAFNDEFGHPAGDEVLKKVARILENEARGTDVIARYGGEEFAVLLVETGSDTAQVIGERFRRAFEAHNWDLRGITVSVGVASWTPDLVGPEQLISNADQALYRAKQAGRNLVVAEATEPAPSRSLVDLIQPGAWRPDETAIGETDPEPALQVVVDDTETSRLQAHS